MPEGYRRIGVFFNAYLSCFGSYLSIHIIQRCKRRSGDSSSAVLLTAKCNSTVPGSTRSIVCGKNMCIYIYPRGRRFTGNSCPKGVYIYEVGVGLGWGGVGMVTFLELAHMVGATQVMGWGGVGVGWGGDDNVL